MVSFSPSGALGGGLWGGGPRSPKSQMKQQDINLAPPHTLNLNFSSLRCALNLRGNRKEAPGVSFSPSAALGGGLMGRGATDLLNLKRNSKT